MLSALVWVSALPRPHGLREGEGLPRKTRVGDRRGDDVNRPGQHLSAAVSTERHKIVPRVVLAAFLRELETAD